MNWCAQSVACKSVWSKKIQCIGIKKSQLWHVQVSEMKGRGTRVCRKSYRQINLMWTGPSILTLLCQGIMIWLDMNVFLAKIPVNSHNSFCSLSLKAVNSANGLNILMLQSEVTVPPICSPRKRITDTKLNKRKFLLSPLIHSFSPRKATQLGFLIPSNHVILLCYHQRYIYV